MHEDAGEVELHLETDVHVRTIDGRRPPQGEATIRNLVETRALRIGKLLVLHRLFKTAGDGNVRNRARSKRRTQVMSEIR